MKFPNVRMRRLRENAGIRNLVSETSFSPADLVMPLFAVEGITAKEEIPSMPGQFRYPLSEIRNVVKELYALGIPAVILFGVPAHKDETATSAYDEHGVVQRALAETKSACPEIVAITDVCLCEYTSHGHCGVVQGERILNDPTLELLARTAVSHARAGADMVAPSDMMDGRVAAIRAALDGGGVETIPIMSYAAKYASAYYGPFRDAAESTPQFGDRRAYQMDPANVRQALREIELDIREGADILMVKPALAYLDVIRAVRDASNLPVAAYNVSGEYSVVKAAAEKGWIDEKRTALENLTAIKRAGADIIITYHAADAARWIG
jgi:porphobilinogen synthase